MDSKEAKTIIDQIRNIILSRPDDKAADIDSSPEWIAVQEAMNYLSECIKETNTFIKHISAGELDVTPPSRNNFMAGELKELQANLRHMTWQANRVANGDYNQRLRFLGEFSNSFNEMVDQLEQREKELKQQADALLKTTEILQLIMDGLNDWIVVTKEDSGEILYLNNSAKNIFCDNILKQGDGSKDCNIGKEILEQIKNRNPNNYEPIIIHCAENDKNFRCRFFKIAWNGKNALAHIISDVTKEQDEKAQLERMAFVDELTGVNNRRFFMQEVEKLLKDNESFSLCNIDLNKLKYANDTFGHSAGDEYIKTSANIMKKAVRGNSDFVCRVGGDEFAVILLNCPEEAAVNKMEQISKEIESKSDKYPMGISFGVYYVNQFSDQTLEQIISIADKRMYKAKKASRQK